jgi:hypothetical protein
MQEISQTGVAIIWLVVRWSQLRKMERLALNEGERSYIRYLV